MKIFVISRESAVDRRESSARQLGNIGLDFEFFDALESVKDVFSQFRGFNGRLYTINTRRSPLPGEIGCFGSHRSLWRKCQDLQEPIIVLEDDFQILRNFNAAVDEVEQLAEEFGFIRLQSLTRGRRRRRIAITPSPYKVLEANGFQLNYLSDVPLCMVAYAINPECAAALIEASASLTAPVDKFIQETWKHKVPIFALSPASVTVCQDFTESTIGVRTNKSWNVGLLLLRLVYKGMGDIRRIAFNQDQLSSLRRRGFDRCSQPSQAIVESLKSL